MAVEQSESEKRPAFPIETIRNSEGAEVSFSPARGGIITSLKLGGREALYLDRTTFDDPNANVKGGIPILFPNAGPLKDSPLQQHGFARTSDRWQATQAPTGFTETLEPSDETRVVYPHEFRLVVTGELQGSNTFVLTQKVQSLSSDTELPLAMGLHPYFPVAEADKGKIVFDFPGGELVASVEEVKKRLEGGTTKFDNPGVPLRVTVPGLGTLVLKASSEYKRIWIWSPPGKDFICIEPVMRDAGGLLNDPELVKPGATFAGTFTIHLE